MKNRMIVQWSTAPREEQWLVGEACTFIRRSEPHGFHVVELASGEQVHIHPENLVDLLVGDRLRECRLSHQRAGDLFELHGLENIGAIRDSLSAEEANDVHAIWKAMRPNAAWWDAFNLVRMARVHRLPRIQSLIDHGLTTDN